MLWESDPVRGPLFKELQVAVREVCESHCYCNNALAFWQDQGAVFEYDMIKKGNEYYCYHDGFEIRVGPSCKCAWPVPSNVVSGSELGWANQSRRASRGSHSFAYHTALCLCLLAGAVVLRVRLAAAGEP